MPVLTRPLPLAQTVADLRAGRVDVAEHVTATLARLQEVEPLLRAFVPEPGRVDRVGAAAAAATGAADRPPLAGALLGVKDIIAVDGLPTRAGSALPPELFAMPEATVVRRLREAGAIVIGKTVTTEFAFMEAGATANPHDQSRTPGGSSSGSAAAVAAGLASLALGTQTVGSVVRPAAFCGVVGFKPSYGRIPTDGVIPFSAAVDTVGTFTQDLAGTALAASVLLDGWAAASSGGPPSLAVPVGPYLAQAEPEGLVAFEAALGRLRAAGVEIREVGAFAEIEAINQRHNDLNAAEFRDVQGEWFASWGALYRGGSAALFDRGGRVSAARREAGLAGRRQLREELEGLMERHGIDAWIAPAAPGPAPPGLDCTGATLLNLPWTHAGLPVLALPAGSLGGLPVAVQLASRFGTDERLLDWATGLEAPLRG